MSRTGSRPRCPDGRPDPPLTVVEDGPILELRRGGDVLASAEPCWGYAVIVHRGHERSTRMADRAVAERLRWHWAADGLPPNEPSDQ